MPYTYQADVWCDDCGEAIKLRIHADSPDMVPTDPDNETTFDSDDYPKRYDAENERSDSPENCASRECGGMWDETKNPADDKYRRMRYGNFLQNGLTQEGYRYLQSMLNEHGEHLPTHAQEWADFYEFSWDEDKTGWYSPEIGD